MDLWDPTYELNPYVLIVSDTLLSFPIILPETIFDGLTSVL